MICCSFCNEIISDRLVKQITCSKKEDLFNDNGKNVCLNCSSVNGYKKASEHFDFYENKSKIVRKSIYHRKYHIQNTINKICREQKLQVLNCDQHKIYRVYNEINNEINNILPQINNRITVKG